MFSLQKMLVATDFSDASDVAVESALDLAEAMGASITLVHTYSLPTYGYPEGAFIPQAEVAHDLVTSLTAALKSEIESHAERRVPMAYVLRLGPAPEVINDVAEEIGADLVVVGTHGRTGLAHALLGSTAEHILRAATLPVLVVRTHAETGHEEQHERDDAPRDASAH